MLLQFSRSVGLSLLEHYFEEEGVNSVAVN